MSYVAQRDIEKKTKELSISQIESVVKIEFNKVSKIIAKSSLTTNNNTYFKKSNVDKGISDLFKYTSKLLAQTIVTSFKNVETVKLGGREEQQFYSLDKLKESINIQVTQQLK